MRLGRGRRARGASNARLRLSLRPAPFSGGSGRNKGNFIVPVGAAKDVGELRGGAVAVRGQGQVWTPRGERGRGPWWGGGGVPPFPHPSGPRGGRGLAALGHCGNLRRPKG